MPDRHEGRLTTSAQVLHAARWNAMVRTTAQLAFWLITIFVMHVLEPIDYGLMNLAEIFMGFCLLVNHLGVIPALVQCPEIDQLLVRKTFGLVLLSNGAFYLIAFIGAPYFAAFFGEARLVAIVRVLTFGLMIGALSAIPTVLLQRELKFKAMSLIEFGAGLIGAATTLVLALEGRGVWSLVLGNLVTTVCTSTGLIVLTRFHILPLFSFAGLGRLFSFGMKVSGSGIFWYFNRNFAELLIGKTLGNRDLGYYSVVSTLAMMPVSKIMSMTAQVAFAAYSRIQNDQVRVRRYFLESTSIACLIFFPVAWGMSAVADDFVAVVLGPQWHEAVPVLRIIALGVPYRAIDLMMGPLVNALGRPGLVLKNTLTGTLIFPASAALGLHWGLIGLCITSLVGSLFCVMIILRRNLALIEIDYGEFFSVICPSMLAAGIMYATVLAARATLLDTMPALWRLPSLVVLGALVYGAVTLTFNRGPVVRSLQLIRGTI